MVFAVFLVFCAVSFLLDFFFVVFGLGVGVWRRFDFDEALGSGVSRGVADGDSPLSSLAFSFAVFFPRFGFGDFGVAAVSASVRDFSDANLARGIAVDAASGVAEA